MTSPALPALLAGRYELGEVLGRGGMAVVHRARDRRLGRDVAVKLLRSELAADPGIRERFGEEAANAARLNHPNVVTVHDTGEHEGVPYLVMECLPGETLVDRLAAGPLSEDEARSLGADVAAALGAAHRLGVVHRDIKPGNILLLAGPFRAGSAKVADFGIAKTAEGLDLTVTGELIGTPAYMAPERLEGRGASPSTDLYSLGVVLYECLAGRKPFPGPTPVAVAQAVHDGAVPPLVEVRADVSPALAAVVERAMARDPEARFAGAEELAEALRGSPGDATTIVRPERHDPTLVVPAVPAPEVRTAPPPQPAWPIRQLVLAGGVVLALLLLLLLVAALDDDDGGAERDDGAATSTSVPGPPLPAPLAGALDRLDRAVGR